jgi:hypothetical protein
MFLEKMIRYAKIVFHLSFRMLSERMMLELILRSKIELRLWLEECW